MAQLVCFSFSAPSKLTEDRSTLTTSLKTCSTARRNVLSVRMSQAPLSKATSEPRKWKCMSQCGACCKLDDYEDDVLHDMLKSEADVAEYLSMVGSDGWCKHFNSNTRQCNKYETRPKFCRATPSIFKELYAVDENQFDNFAISCCEFHIENAYGSDSIEVFQFDDFINNTQ